MSDEQREIYPISNVGECPFCHKNSNYVERMTLDSCAVICDCGAQGPSSCPESDEDNEIEDENDLDPGYLAAVRLWRAKKAKGVEIKGWVGHHKNRKIWSYSHGPDHPAPSRFVDWERVYPEPQPPKAVPDAIDLLTRIAQGLSIIEQSEGIAGWHMNGEVSRWDEGDLPGLLEEVREFLGAHQEGE